MSGHFMSIIPFPDHLTSRELISNHKYLIFHVLRILNNYLLQPVFAFQTVLNQNL